MKQFNIGQVDMTQSNQYSMQSHNNDNDDLNNLLKNMQVNDTMENLSDNATMIFEKQKKVYIPIF